MFDNSVYKTFIISTIVDLDDQKMNMSVSIRHL